MTTKDGIRSQTMIRPSIAEIAMQTTMPARIATGVGQGLWTETIQIVMVPPIAALKPTRQVDLAEQQDERLRHGDA